MFRILALSLMVVVYLTAAVSAHQVTSPPKAQETEPVELKVGDKAPDWELMGSNGKTYKLSNYKGKQAVVVAWYPMALTGG